MKVAYAYEFDAADPMVQSGRPASILGQLENLGMDVAPVFPLDRNTQFLFAPKAAWHHLRGRVYRPDREPRYLRSLARQVQTRVQDLGPDVVFAPGSHSVARLDVDCPIVFCADATFANVLDTYDSFSQCAPEFIAQGHAQERAALGRCAAAIFPSEWAARSAIDFYGADPARVHVVPFGANVKAPDNAAVQRWIDARRLNPLRILFVGRDWARKGANLVLETCALLHASGQEIRLDLVGIDRPPMPLPPWATNHGLLDKRDPAQKQRLEELLQHSHFFFVPSQAENYGMAFCEAAAYGLPSLTTDAGGIPTIVRHAITGYTLSPTAPPSDWAAALSAAVVETEAYRAMASASRTDYEKRLNWPAFALRLEQVLRHVTTSAVRHPTQDPP